MARAFDEADDLRRSLYKTLAFIGRYGHQDVTQVKRWPMDAIYLFADQVGEIMREENDAVRAHQETNGA